MKKILANQNKILKYIRFLKDEKKCCIENIYKIFDEKKEFIGDIVLMFDGPKEEITKINKGILHLLSLMGNTISPKKEYFND